MKRKIISNSKRKIGEKRYEGEIGKRWKNGEERKEMKKWKEMKIEYDTKR